MIYKVLITETRQRYVSVDAHTLSEAQQRVSDAWHNNEIMLNDNDFEGVEVYVIGEAGPDEHLFKVEAKE